MCSNQVLHVRCACLARYRNMRAVKRKYRPLFRWSLLTTTSCTLDLKALHPWFATGPVLGTTGSWCWCYSRDGVPQWQSRAQLAACPHADHKADWHHLLCQCWLSHGA